MQTLAALMARIVDGDRAAFRSLYEATSAQLFGVILIVVTDRREAEEVLLETYVAIWRKAAAFDAQRGLPMTWLIAIARNRAIDQLRKRPHKSILESDELPDISAPSAPADMRTSASGDNRC